MLTSDSFLVETARSVSCVRAGPGLLVSPLYYNRTSCTIFRAPCKRKQGSPCSESTTHFKMAMTGLRTKSRAFLKRGAVSGCTGLTPIELALPSRMGSVSDPTCPWAHRASQSKKKKICWTWDPDVVPTWYVAVLSASLCKFIWSHLDVSLHTCSPLPAFPISGNSTVSYSATQPKGVILIPLFPSPSTAKLLVHS